MERTINYFKVRDLLAHAMSQYGISEWAGDEHNPEVMKYFSEIGHGWVQDDETAWCAAFLNWALLKSGLRHTGKLNARSFMGIGTGVSGESSWMAGDIVVLWRDYPASAYGHVGILVHTDNDYVYLLGGNQGNQINIAKYPKARIISVRRITTADAVNNNEIKGEGPNIKELPTITDTNSMSRVFVSLQKERDFQDKTAIAPGTGIMDPQKAVVEWVGLMEQQLDKAKRAYYERDQIRAMSAVRKATALGVAAMQWNKYPERVVEDKS